MARRPPEMVVELFEPAPPTPPPAPQPPDPPRVRRLSLPTNPSPTTPSERSASPAPAQAAEVVARETPAEEPVDLTGFSVVTGKGDRYSGGSTTSSGTNARAVTGAVFAGGDSAVGAPEPDLSRPVGIRDTDLQNCPEADALGIDGQTAAIRVTVRADGRFESGEVVHEPGEGIGAAAIACAKRQGFNPALDRRGKPIRARSAIIRFTFTR